MRIRQVLLRDSSRCRGSGQDHLPDVESAQRVVLMTRFNQRTDLRNDVVGSRVWKDKILVTCFIVRNESRRSARQHLETDDSAVHRINLNEVENPWIPARVHGLRQDQSIEFAVVLWLSNDDPRFVRLT